MNIEQAKAIPIAEIFAKIELKPVKENQTDAYYFSIYKPERTASLHVNKIDNVWYEHSEGIGGNAFDLVIQILKVQGHDHAPVDGLRWIDNTNLNPLLLKPRDLVKGKKSKWKMLWTKPLHNRALVNYLHDRGINPDLARKYVEEIYLQKKCSPTKIFAIGFKNEDGGYEFRNRVFKSCTSPKTITFIRAGKPKPDGVMIFEGFMDFLTYVTIKEGKLNCDNIVLNSVACVDHAVRYIKNYGYKRAYTWADNDKAGERATQRLQEFLKSEPNLIFKPLNHMYAKHKDLNAWHMHIHNLQPLS